MTADVYRSDYVTSANGRGREGRVWSTHRGVLLVLVLALLSGVGGLRLLGEDRDYAQYLFFYESQTEDELSLDARYEPGFVAFAWFARNVLGLDFEAFLMLLVGVALGIKFRLLLGRPHAWLLISAYVPSLYLLHEMTQIRVAVALAFAYLAGNQILAGRKWRAWTSMLVGVSMHASVMVFMPLLFASRPWLQRSRLSSPYTIAVVLLPALAVYLLLDYLGNLNPLMQLYMDASGDLEVNLLSIRSVALVVLLLIGAVGYRGFSPAAKIQVLVGLAGVASFLALSSWPTLAHRTLELSLFSYLLWVTVVPRVYSIPATVGFLALSGYLGYRQVVIDPLFL